MTIRRISKKDIHPDYHGEANLVIDEDGKMRLEPIRKKGIVAFVRRAWFNVKRRKVT